MELLGDRMFGIVLMMVIELPYLVIFYWNGAK